LVTDIEILPKEECENWFDYLLRNKKWWTAPAIDKVLANFF